MQEVEVVFTSTKRCSMQLMREHMVVHCDATTTGCPRGVYIVHACVRVCAVLVITQANASESPAN